jgi:hypothetical protein
MDAETETKLTIMARQIAQEMCRNQGTAMLPASPNAIQACGSITPTNGCEGLQYAPITTFRFLRSGRTDLNVITSRARSPWCRARRWTLSQDVHPPWPTGCYSLRYRLANNGNNHDEIQIEWFIDDEQLDTKHFGSEIYNNDGTVIGDGLLPVPLAMGQHCCVGGNNRLRARISHLGNNNQIENIRLFVHHGKAVTCCSSCSMGRSCDCGKSST